MNWEVIISGAAFLVSGIVAVYSYLQGRKSNEMQKEQTELQRRVVELEEQREEKKKRLQKKAEIRAVIDFEETGGHRLPRKILIWNHGPADAENIEVLVDGLPPSEVEYLYTERRNDTVEVLPAGDYYDYSFGNREENQAPIDITVTYDDLLDEKQEYKTKLRL
jgi:hypothetical protein